MIQTFKKTLDSILPPGDYYLGDVSYFLQDSLMKGVLSGAFGDGCFVDESGVGFAVVNPTAGPGLYKGSDKHSYEFEDGGFGLVPTSLGNIKKYTGSGTFHTFTEPVSFYLDDDGIITVKSGDWFLDIDTNSVESIYSDDEGYDSWG